MAGLPTGPCAVLDQAIHCVEGLQFEACVPLLFASQMTLPGETSILNLSYTPYGLNAGYDGSAGLTSSISVAGVQYAVQPHYGIDILRFLRFIYSDAFLMVILHSISWSR
jgi:hypothetical protein